jgi:8-oxo-dGTP pyrophosphatase MutT (NUDIX family)
MSENYFFQVSLKLLIHNSEGEVLLLKGLADGPMAGLYDFPGGRIAEGENAEPFESIMKREVAEELGADFAWQLRSKNPVTVARHHYTSKKYGHDLTVLWLLFEADTLSDKITISPEHSGYKWIDIKSIVLEDYFVNGPLEVMRNYRGIK